MKNKNLLAIFIGLSLCAPLFVAAAAKAPVAPALKYAAWVPFWKKEQGAGEISLRLPKFSEISPFSYEVNPDGTLKDSLKIDVGFWPDWFTVARGVHVKILPTVAFLDGDAIHKLLSDTKLRRQHATNIAAMVRAEKFDGVDIDYEDKNSETKAYFSLFIEGLSDKLHAAKKTLSCTIEARTPAVDRFKVPRTDLAYANDYKAINKYCDQVRIMAYDQGAIDLNLNNQKGSGGFYMPVADPDWVEKVIKETIRTISPKKIMLGIPTYGYQYEVSWSPSLTTYKRLRSETFSHATELAKTVSSTIWRNSAGESSFSFASSTSLVISPRLTFIVDATTTPPLFPTASTSMPVTHFVSFSDASSSAQKIQLAKKYKLRGVVFFKMDGETDPALWDQIK